MSVDYLDDFRDELRRLGEVVWVRDGQTLAMGRFAFRFHTAPGFYAHVKSLLA